MRAPVDKSKIRDCFKSSLAETDFLSSCNRTIESFGIPPTAQAIADLYNRDGLDIWDGFLSVCKETPDFWSIDSLIYDTVKQCNSLDLEKIIRLCAKLSELEGHDLAAGRLYGVVESKLSGNWNLAKQAFDLSLEKDAPRGALPCITRALASVDPNRTAELLLELLAHMPAEDLLLPVVFSLQFCVTADVGIVKKVSIWLDKFSELKSTSDVKRATYMSARKWKQDAICEKLLNEGDQGVLSAASFDLVPKRSSSGANDFKKQLAYFRKVELNSKGILDRVDYALAQNYEHHPAECLDFAKNYLAEAVHKHLAKDEIKTIFPHFTRHLATELSESDLVALLVELLTSNSPSQEFFAYLIANQVEFEREIEYVPLSGDKTNLTYLVFKTLGWLYGCKKLCVPIVEASVASMRLSEFDALGDAFYDPFCLHFHDFVEKWLATNPSFVDAEVESKVRAVAVRVKDFYLVFKQNGPCKELHPSAEMRALAVEREEKKMSDLAQKSMSEGLLNFIGTRISLLHGGKMVEYIRGEDGSPRRTVCPMHHNSISWPIPKLLVLNGTALEDKLLGYRMVKLVK